MRLLWMLVLLGSTTVASANGLLTTFPPLAGNVPLEASLLSESNAARGRNGLPPLVQNERLALAARHHAAEMAELGFLAHQSPSQGSQTLSRRLNNAGIMLEAAAENLAFISGGSGIAAATVQGWLDSPGHRANLLGDFTMVGFGTAQNDSGTTYVVQVLGRETLGLKQANVREITRSTLQLNLQVQIMNEARIGVWLAGEFLAEDTFPPGRAVISVPVGTTGPVHVSTGALTPPYLEGAPFIAGDSGWFDPGAGTWTADQGTNRRDLAIESVSAGWLDEVVWRVELELEQVPAERIGIWLDGQFSTGFGQNGTSLSVDVPAVHAPGTVLSVGLEEQAGLGSYRIAAEFLLQFDPAGRPALSARNPGD